MANTYRPTRRALEYAKTTLASARVLNYGETYTVRQIIDTAEAEDGPFYPNGPEDGVSFYAVKAWATALWNGDRAAHITTPTDLNA